MSIQRLLVVILAVILIVSVYFLPTGIALLRRHLNTGAIFMLNLLLGWTFIAWAVAIVWAFTSNTAGRTGQTGA